MLDGADRFVGSPCVNAPPCSAGACRPSCERGSGSAAGGRLQGDQARDPPCDARGAAGALHVGADPMCAPARATAASRRRSGTGRASSSGHATRPSATPRCARPPLPRLSASASSPPHARVALQPRSLPSQERARRYYELRRRTLLAANTAQVRACLLALPLLPPPARHALPVRPRPCYNRSCTGRSPTSRRQRSSSSGPSRPSTPWAPRRRRPGRWPQGASRSPPAPTSAPTWARRWPSSTGCAGGRWRSTRVREGSRGWGGR